MTRAGRIVVASALALVAAGIIVFAFLNLTSQPNTIEFTATNGQVNVTMQTVGSYGSVRIPPGCRT